MKRILIRMPGMDHGKLFNADARDGVCDPFIYLRDRLQQHGYILETADDMNVEGCAWVWIWDAVGINQPRHWLRELGRRTKRNVTGRQGNRENDLYQACVRAGLKERTVLIIGEPPVVYPPNWNPEIHKLFPTIFTWNDDYADGKKFYKFCWPLTGWFPKIPALPFNQRKLLVNISGNKFSSHPKELFTARRETIGYFERHHPDQFDLYGIGWNQGQPAHDFYPSYKGTVKHKWDVYPQYRFGVCYENMRHAPGWVTEKIFDSMRSGCVPVYWGAPNIADFVDAETFVDRRTFGSDAELADFLLKMTEKEYMRYQQAIQAYLHSERFAAFLPPAFADTICRVLAI